MAGNHSRGGLPKFALQQIVPYYFEGKRYEEMELIAIVNAF